MNINDRLINTLISRLAARRSGFLSEELTGVSLAPNWYHGSGKNQKATLVASRLGDTGGSRHPGLGAQSPSRKIDASVDDAQMSAPKY